MISQQSTLISLDKVHPNPPGPPPLPFFGMWTFIGKHLHLELTKLAKKHGNIFQIHVGNKTLVVLNGHEIIKQALVKQSDSFNIRADFEVFRQPPQSNFLELKSGEIWKRHHSIVGQIMHTFAVCKSDNLESWAIEEAVDLANIFVDSNGQPFDPDLYLPLATLSFMQRLIFGKKASFKDLEADPEFTATAHNLKHIPKVLDAIKLEFIPAIWQPIFKLYRLKVLQKFLTGLTALENYVSKNVARHQESFDPENLQDITDGLLQASRELTPLDRNQLGLSKDDIVNGSLMQFAGAGGGLPSIILRWALLYAIAYPDIQAQIQKELDEVVGKEQPCSKHRGKLPFTEAFLNEVLRHSSITTMPPITYATSTDTTLDGYFIAKNTPILVNYYSLTRDERYWSEPEKFDPYRFLNKDGQLKNNLIDKFYPFGVGSRRCIGEYLGRFSIFLFLTNLLHRCKFERVPGEKLSLEPIPGAFVVPENYKVVVKPRF